VEAEEGEEGEEGVVVEVMEEEVVVGASLT
jgi:hypothetical protein